MTALLLAPARLPLSSTSTANAGDVVLRRDSLDDGNNHTEYQDFAVLDEHASPVRGRFVPDRFDPRHEYLRSLLNTGSTVWSGFGAGKQAIESISVPEAAAAAYGRPLAARNGRRASLGYRSLTEPASPTMATDIETAPGSPPELSYSKSSKSDSSSIRSLSDDESVGKLSHFEDITLEEGGRGSVEDSNLKPESRPTLRRPPPRTIDLAKTRSQPSELRNTGDRRYPGLQIPANGGSANLPMGRGMRRGFSSPSSPSFFMHTRASTSSRSPSPSKGFLSNGMHSAPRSASDITPTSSTTNLSGSFARRPSWQPGKKTVKELEAEYDDLDEEVPDEAILENVPITPMPGQPRASRTPSPQPLPSHTNLRNLKSAGAHSGLHSANVPRKAKRPSAPHSLPNGQVRSPRSPKNPRPGMPHSATVSHFPPEPFGKKPRSKSWTDDLNEEAKQLSAALEEYADRLSNENQRSAPSSAANSPPRPSLSAKSRTKTSIAEMPPLQKGNIMIDPLPISKEKEAVLSRTRPSWLPPKCQKEEKRHMKEWEAMMARAAEAEKKRAVKQKEAEDNKMELDGSIARIWEQHVLPSWDKVIHEPRTRELWWRGVTPSSRGAVWQRAIGNDLELNAASFSAALARAQSLEDRLASLPAEDRAKSNEAAWLDAIARDVPSVFPDKEQRQALASVLKAYSMYRSDVGYVYGTHLIAGQLCQYLEPSAAFVTLANLLNRPLPLAFLVHDQAAMSRAHAQILSTLSYKCPNLHAHLTNPALDLQPAEFLDPLLRCLFTYNLPHEHAARVWDLYVFEGEKALVRAAVGVLSILESKLYGGREEVLDLISWRNEKKWQLGTEEDFIKAVREAGKVEVNGGKRMS